MEIDQLKWEPVELEPGVEQWSPVALTDDERAVFEECRPRDLVRLADGAVVGYRPAEIVTLRDGVTRATQISGGVDRLIPSPSGTRVLAFREKKPIVEVAIDQPVATEVVPYTKGEHRWDIDYVGDDDTLVLGLSDGDNTALLEVWRRGADGVFEKASKKKGKTSGLASTGNLIVSLGSRKPTVWRLDGDKLAKLGTIDAADKAGWLRPHPSDRRDEIHHIAGEHAYRLIGLPPAIG